jgi:chromosome segregation protein
LRALVAGGAAGSSPEPPVDGARRLLDLVKAEGAAGEVAEHLLSDAWLVDDLTDLPPDFDGIAVTVDGDAFDGAARELRRLPREGTDPALAARSAREELSSRLDQRRQTEERAARDLERAEEGLAAARKARDETEYAQREARRKLDEATEEASRTGWIADRRAERGEEGEATVQRARLEAELSAERRHADSARRAIAARRRDQERLSARIALEQETLPSLEAAREALLRLTGVLERRDEQLVTAPAEEGGGEVAAELRECSQQEYGLQNEFREMSEGLTAAEVEASQLRDRRDESASELTRLGSTLDRELGAADAPLSEEAREEILAKLARVERRREQIGPVNPLAEREYTEAAEHVRDLTAQRKDLESALVELKSLIRRTDREIAQSFEETFEATARNFEEMVSELFPGGRGRLRKIDAPPPRAVAEQDGDGGSENGTAAEDEADDFGAPTDEHWGVEIEVTPEGKSTRRLSLLSGGEKSLVALAFVFAVLMARPCPFYILDEVEAALDDINLDRFLRLVRRFAERSQFVVVTHQKRTMDAADILYGVSMGGDGVTKVVSRRLPRDRDLSDAAEVPGAEDPTAEAA